ncbi:MAG TPA: hypothetical protein VI094_04120 [Propionibacteriaceae bacterium]
MDRLEDVLRAGESSDDLVLLLRGGEDTRAKLLRQAALFEARYTYRGERARGMSLFAASSAVDELAVLESKLRTYPKYRRVRGVELAEIAVLVPTFQAPHWTVLFQRPCGARRPEEELLSDLLDILGPVLDNPRYVPDRLRRR